MKFLVDKVFKKNEYTKESVAKIIKSTFDTIAEMLENDQELILRGYMSFLFSQTKQRVIVDPFGVKTVIPSRKRLRIKPGNILTKKIGYRKVTRWERIQKKIKIQEEQERLLNGSLSSPSRMSSGRRGRVGRPRGRSSCQSEAQ